MLGKADLRKGFAIDLQANKVVRVRISNEVDYDHMGPAVEIVSPQYLNAQQIKMHIPGIGWATEPVPCPEEGLEIEIYAKDRSGIAWVDVYLDWKKVGRLEAAPYKFKVPKSVVSDGPHAVYAVASDALGNQRTSFTVPFMVGERPTPKHTEKGKP